MIQHNFDEIIERPVPIKVLGKVRNILPISLETLLVLTNEVRKVERGELGEKSIIESYFEVFKLAIDDITLDEMKLMQPIQITGIYTLILRRLQGESTESLQGMDDAEVKKKPSKVST